VSEIAFNHLPVLVALMDHYKRETLLAGYLRLLARSGGFQP